jgi:hypothetical protein
MPIPTTRQNAATNQSARPFERRVSGSIEEANNCGSAYALGAGSGSMTAVSASRGSAKPSPGSDADTRRA